VDVIAAVVPYFQREPGVLRKAIASALRQTGVVPFPIIVIDDASPVPAADEIGQLAPAHRERIRVIERENGGPAAARNSGLEALIGSTRYVAFLDSDDQWTEGHIANAIRVLEEGYDFYFADHYQLDQEVSAFERAGRIDPHEHEAIFPQEPFYRYRGDMFAQILTGNVIGTSTVAYRFEKFPGLRFRTEFQYAGEDYLFWLEFTQQTSAFAFSGLVECRYGRGVNVFSGSGWGTDSFGIRIHQEMKYRKTVERLFTLTPELKQANSQAIRGLRTAYIADLLHRLRHGKRVDAASIWAQLRLDPLTALLFVPISGSLLLSRGASQSR
jgi:succinoglycan biosynthesis protein ExoW